MNPLRLALLLVLLGTPASLSAESLQPFRFQLLWTPQAQFLGYYMADVLGYYEEHGLAVEILPGGPTVRTTQRLQSGQVDAINEWLPTALTERENGIPLINVAQIFQHTGFMLICHRDRGIRQPADLQGKTIGVWQNGSYLPVTGWLNRSGLTIGEDPGNVQLYQQSADVLQAWNNPSIDCVSAMSYNEYWTLLKDGGSATNLTIFDFAELGFSFLEDGIYVDPGRLKDPKFRDRLGRFLDASLRGWQYALSRPGESVTILTQLFELDERHQLHMINEIARLIDAQEIPLGYLRVEAYDQTLDFFRLDVPDTDFLASQGRRIWTHDVWSQLDETSYGVYDAEVRYRLQQVLNYNAFYLLDLLGTLAFAIAGFARAQQRKYSIWGALALASLAAVGGGTLRDLLVGGDRHPPFIFGDPNYLYIIASVVLFGSLSHILSRNPQPLGEKFPRLLLVIDTVGLAAFCIIGAKVAIVAQLDWFWIPLLAALTCAGGGVLLDIVTGQEPRTFRGVMYEEIAVLGGLFLFCMLYFANFVSNVEDYIELSITLTFVFVFTLRVAVVARGARSAMLR
ncbi:MAG: ABC transporter substrate-binding protein [Pseudomonadota bacterium]